MCVTNNGRSCKYTTVINNARPFFVLERGKTLYGLQQYEQAIEKLEEVVIPEVLHHPIDLSVFYEKDAYMALCYLELGQAKKVVSLS